MTFEHVHSAIFKEYVLKTAGFSHFGPDFPLNKLIILSHQELNPKLKKNYKCKKILTKIKNLLGPNNFIIYHIETLKEKSMKWK